MRSQHNYGPRYASIVCQLVQLTSLVRCCSLAFGTSVASASGSLATLHALNTLVVANHSQLVNEIHVALSSRISSHCFVLPTTPHASTRSRTSSLLGYFGSKGAMDVLLPKREAM